MGSLFAESDLFKTTLGWIYIILIVHFCNVPIQFIITELYQKHVNIVITRALL